MRNTHSSPSIFWWGQIVDDSVWKDNLPSKKWNYADEIPGYGTRYKVAILGRDSENKDVPDEKLEWADVGYPVTAGSGHKGQYETSNLSKGSYVYGIYKDGINMSEPIILGCYENNHQINLEQSIPSKNFVPFSGYIEERVAYHDIAPEGSFPPNAVPFKGVYGIELRKNERFPSESNQKQIKGNISDQTSQKEGFKDVTLFTTEECNKIPEGAIQRSIREFIQDIQEFKDQANSWKSNVLSGKFISEEGKKYSLEEYIAYKAERVSKEVSGFMKTVVTGIQGYVERRVDGILKDTYDLLPPDIRATAKMPVENATDLLACLFRRIILNLLKMIRKFLLQIAERFINAPLCAVQNFVSSLIGNLAAFITGAVQSILAPLKAVLGIVDIIGDVLGFIEDILSFLLCDEKPGCPEVIAWSSWSGPTEFLSGTDITNIFEKAKTIASKFQQSIDPNNFDFDLDFSDAFQDTCNVGPIFCGPPIVQIYGGGGSGAAGNAVISAAGDILGVDLTSFGGGYTSPPTVRFIDACGKGKSATARAIIGPVTVGTLPGIGTTGIGTTGIGTTGIGTTGIGTTGIGTTGIGTTGIGTTGIGTTGAGRTTNGVIAIIMTDPGFGYLSFPNGDLGGDNRVWAKSNQTTVKRNDGKYDRPYNPGETISVNPKDEVMFFGIKNVITESGLITAPDFSTQTGLTTFVTPSSGLSTVTLPPISLGLTTSITLPIGFTTSSTGLPILPRGDGPSLNNGRYPVILEIDFAIIENPGINYSPSDQIEVIPNNGAVLRPVFNSAGSLESINVVNGGIGFKEMPEIKIKSKTGYNAKILPVFKINKDIAELQRIQESKAISQDQIISVVDCVGKI